MSEVDPFAPFAPFVDMLAERIVDKWLEKTDLRMVSQSVSPLGPRKHREAVKRRIRNNEGGAHIDRRRHLLTREALAEELRGARPKAAEGQTTAPPDPASPPPTTPDVAAYTRDLLARVRSMRGPKR